MADGPHINKFETVDLASFYKSNGSQFAGIQTGPGQSTRLGPQVNTNTNKTPLTALAKTSPSIGAFSPGPITSNVEVFNLPSTPQKIGIDAAGFLFSPAFTTPNVSNNMSSPGQSAPQLSAFGFTPAFTTPELKIVNGIPDIDASGFTKNMSYPNSTFKGISKSSPLTFTSAKLSTQLKVHNGLADIDMNGFITGKKHLGPSDFTGVVGKMPNLQFKMSTNNPGTTSTWTRQQYNEKVGGGYNSIADIKQTGFNLKTLGQYRGASDFLGISGNTYDYPKSPGTNRSYGFGVERYDSVLSKVIPSSAPGKIDSIGQRFKLLGGTSPYGDTSISARKSQLGNDSFDSKIQKQYLEIPGIGPTDLRRESTNVHSFGRATDQPFVQRDIGSNWSLFSDSPSAKGGKGSLLSIDLIRGGVGTAINRSLFDALRIGKFLISPKGLLFIAKNVGMQLTNPKMQVDKLLGIGANRIYALGLPTVAQTLTNAVGIHLVRHGLGPLNGQLGGSARYENNIYQSESPLAQGGAGQGAKSALKKAGFDSPDTSDLTDKADVSLDSSTGEATTLGKGSPRTKSRLAFLQTDMKSGLLAVSDAGGKGAGKPDGFGDLAGAIKSKIPGFTRGMGKTKITRLSDKGFLGPGSVYGIGGTSIFRSNAGIGISQHEQTGGTYADSKFFSGKQAFGENPSFARVIDTPDEGNRYSDKNGTNTYDEMFTEGSNTSQQALILDNILAIDGIDAAPDDSSGDSTSGGHQPFPDLSAGNLYVSNNQNLRRYNTLAYGAIPRSADRLGNPLMDFRELMDNVNLNFQQPNGGDSVALPWEGLDRMTRFGGNYGRINSLGGGSTNMDRSDRKVDLGLDDTVVDPTSIVPGTSGEKSAEYADVFDDFINFKFSSKRPNTAEETLQFRAYLDGISDSFNYGWQDVSYVGRTTPTYLFQSIERAASFNFKVYSFTRAEMEANYKRLNRFIQMTSPEIQSGLPVGPLLKLTIGDWWKENPFVLDSFTMTPVDNAPWDIDEGRQLPFYINCAVSGKILFSKANIGGDVTDRVHSSTTDAFAAITNDSWRQ